MDIIYALFNTFLHRITLSFTQLLAHFLLCQTFDQMSEIMQFIGYE